MFPNLLSSIRPVHFLSRQVKDRRLGDRPVRTYDDLVEWLLSKGQAAQKDYLKFFGKNLVVFTV